MPAWCAKPKPCDYDKGSAYCPHRECRQKLEALHPVSTPLLTRHELERELERYRALADSLIQAYESALAGRRPLVDSIVPVVNRAHELQKEIGPAEARPK